MSDQQSKAEYQENVAADPQENVAADPQAVRAQPETTEGEDELERLERRLREIMNDEAIMDGLGRIEVLHRDGDPQPIIHEQSYMDGYTAGFGDGKLFVENTASYTVAPGMPSPPGGGFDYRDREIKSLKKTISNLRERHRNDYADGEVLRHIARAEGLIEADGQWKAIFREILLAIQFLVNRD